MGVVHCNAYYFNLHSTSQILANCFFYVQRSEELIIPIFMVQEHESSLKWVPIDISKKHASFIIRVEK
jgi:hypothetical protein